MSASPLDAAQSAIPFEEWLQKTFAFHEPPTWRMGGCDLRSGGEAAADVDLCVEVHGLPDPGGFGARIHVLVGNFAQGAVGKPSVHAQAFLWRRCRNEPDVTADYYTDVDSLSKIEETIAFARTKPCWPIVLRSRPRYDGTPARSSLWMVIP
jgi:hypothetical protein